MPGRGRIRRCSQRVIERIGTKMEIKLRDEFIKLGQALKAAGLVESGVDAKFAIQDGLVKVNGAVETQRGKKLYDGDEIQYDGETVTITK